MFDHVKVVPRVSKVIKWNKESDETEIMLFAREERENIISYVDFSIISHVIKCFTYSKQKFKKEDINFTLYSSSRVIEWRKIIW